MDHDKSIPKASDIRITAIGTYIPERRIANRDRLEALGLKIETPPSFLETPRRYRTYAAMALVMLSSIRISEPNRQARGASCRMAC